MVFYGVLWCFTPSLSMIIIIGCKVIKIGCKQPTKQGYYDTYV